VLGAGIEVAADVMQKFPDLRVLLCEVQGVEISDVDPQLEEFKEKVCADVKRRFTLEDLKDEPVFRAYRDFFWRIGIDPTKTRPAAEALIRRVLGGRALPRINTAVDAYNLASMKTCVALAAFDIGKLEGQLRMRFAEVGEAFFGIGMDKPVTTAGGEIVMADAARLVAIYPHRDADYSRLTLQTKNLLLVSCGAPDISLAQLEEAANTASEFVIRFCGGVASRVF
jgi:DNA/RNA-binding domain of Phe-tRNA-synthetase-like protein